VGYETALALARKGYVTYAGIKAPAQAKKLSHIANIEKLPLQLINLDVNRSSSVTSAVKQVLKNEGLIDLLVNGTGYVLLGCFEDISMKEMAAQFETNFYGIARMLRSVLPFMRKQRSGVIININSVAGQIGFPCSSAFVCSQFAIQGLSESLRYELEPFGIDVSLIEPGIIRPSTFTNLIVVAQRAKRLSSPYSDITRKLTNDIGRMPELGSLPVEVASTVLKAIQSKPILPRYLVGNDAAMITELRKSMTDIEFENFVKCTILSV
jgi:NAD(P)-dependent dehydrogenase (short-subunit alcohol dehydrogenase family)